MERQKSSEIWEKIGLKTKIKLSESLRGNKSYNWKGGQEIKRQIRDNFKYRKWRMDIFERDNWTCQFCRIRGVYLEAHHIKKFSSIVRENNIKVLEQALNCDELWDIDNGVTLCKDCHKLTDNYGEKCNK